MSTQAFRIPQGPWINRDGTATLSFYKFIFNLWNQTAAAGIPSGGIYSNISGVVSPPVSNTLTAILDAVMGSAEGNIIARGAVSWSALALGSANTLLSSNGTDVLYQSLSTILNNVISNTRGAIAVRGSSAWQALALGSNGQALVSNGTDLVSALVSQLAATITLAAAGTITTASGGLSVGSNTGDVSVGSGTGTVTLGTSGGTLKTGQTAAAATSAPAFAADHRIQIKDGAGTTYYVPASTTAW